MIRVAIVEDHPAIADGLAALMQGSSGVTIVGTARDVRSASVLIERESPDVVLCDIRLTDAGDGFDLVKRHQSGPAFIILSAYWYPSYHVKAVKLGAKGYLSKMATVEQILSAVETVAAGGTAFPSPPGGPRAMRFAFRALGSWTSSPSLPRACRTPRSRSSCRCGSRRSRASCAGCSIGTTSPAGRRSSGWPRARVGSKKIARWRRAAAGRQGQGVAADRNRDGSR